MHARGVVAPAGTPVAAGQRDPREVPLSPAHLADLLERVGLAGAVVGQHVGVHVHSHLGACRVGGGTEWGWRAESTE